MWTFQIQEKLKLLSLSSNLSYASGRNAALDSLPGVTQGYDDLLSYIGVTQMILLLGLKVFCFV